MAMAIARGYEYDLFVSYCHVDDAEGWITDFVRRLGRALPSRLSGNEPTIFFDDSERRANSQIAEILAKVKESALFLAFGSPSYATRDWPRQEVEAFFERVGDPSRVFVVEYLPLNEGETYPSILRGHIPLKLYKESGTRKVPVPFLPPKDEEDLQTVIGALATDIRRKLLPLRLLVTPPAEAPEPQTAVKPMASRGKTVLLAQVPDDLEDEADQVRSYLRQYPEITILPHNAYPQGGGAFREAIERDLAQSDLFVQLLGRRSGRVPPDLPEGYTSYQLMAARQKGVKILQWRRSDLDVDAVSDVAYRRVLTGDSVIASGLETFKRTVLDFLRKPESPPRPQRFCCTVFIDADDNDLPFAHEIETECRQQMLTTILPMTGSTAEAIRRDLADSFLDCDGLLFIYGNTTPDWIRTQLRFFSKVKPKRETDPRIIAICCGPPPDKPDIGMTFPNTRVISLPHAWDMAPIRTLISELAQ